MASSRWRFSQVSRRQTIVLVLIGAIGFYTLYPLALLVFHSFDISGFGQSAQLSLENWRQAWATPGLLRSLGNTLFIGAATLAISFPIAVIISWVLARTDIPFAGWIELVFWVSFFLPRLTTTVGWMLVLDPQVGLLNQFFTRFLGFDHGPFNIFSFPGIIWVHLVGGTIAIKVMLLVPAFRNMDATMEEASRMSGASTLWTFLCVTLPVVTPALVVVFMLHLVRLFESFEIELLLGTPAGIFVYSTKIATLVQTEPPELGQATALGSITLLILVVVLPFQRWLSVRRQYTTITGRMKPALITLGSWRWVVFTLIAGAAAMMFVVPLVSALAASFMTRFGFFELAHAWTLDHWKRTLGDQVFLSSLRNTLILAGASAVGGTLVFSLVAYVIARFRGVSGLGMLDSIVWIPSVIPGILAGLGLLWMFTGTPLFRPLYGSIFLLIIATSLATITLATQVIKAALLQMGTELEEASRMSGAGWFSTYVHVVIRLLAPALLTVATLKFLFSASDVSRVILLAGAHSRPLSLLVVDFVSEGARESAVVATLVITALTTGVAVVVRSLGVNVNIRR